MTSHHFEGAQILSQLQCSGISILRVWCYVCCFQIISHYLYYFKVQYSSYLLFPLDNKLFERYCVEFLVEWIYFGVECIGTWLASLSVTGQAVFLWYFSPAQFVSHPPHNQVSTELVLSMLTIPLCAKRCENIALGLRDTPVCLLKLTAGCLPCLSDLA